MAIESAELAVVYARLQRLERSVRRWKTALVLTAISFGCVVLIAADELPQAPPGLPPPSGLPGAQTPQVADVITAKRFDLVDNTGRVRAQLRMLDSGSRPSLLLSDERSNVHVRLQETPEGGTLDLVDDKQKLRAQLGAFAESAAIAVYDENSLIRGQIMTSGELSQLALADAHGVVRVGIKAETSARSQVLVYDKSGKYRVGAIGSNDTDDGFLQLRAHNNEAIFGR